MKHHVISLFLVIGIFQENTCQRHSEDNMLYWKDGMNLKWEDFQEKIVDSSSMQASASVQIKYEYKFNRSGNRLKYYDVRCYLIKTNSWYSQTSTELLLHEQKHFDIGEIVARQARMKFNEIKKGDSIIDNHKMRSLIREFTNKLYLMQVTYDKETNHSLDSIMQIKWNEKIEIELDGLKKYR